MSEQSDYIEFGNSLRNQSERLQAWRIRLRIVTFGLSSLFFILKFGGAEVFLIILPEVIAFVLYIRIRKLVFAYRRLRHALLLQDSFGEEVDRDVVTDIRHDLLQDLRNSPAAAGASPYYSSTAPIGFNRFLENIHESTYFWAEILREQRQRIKFPLIVGAAALVAVLISIVLPAIASTLLTVAVLVVALFFVSEQVNELADIYRFNREFLRLERDLAALRSESQVSESQTLLMMGRYAALSHAAPICPERVFSSINPRVSAQWSSRNMELIKKPDVEVLR